MEIEERNEGQGSDDAGPAHHRSRGAAWDGDGRHAAETDPAPAGRGRRGTAHGDHHRSGPEAGELRAGPRRAPVARGPAPPPGDRAGAGGAPGEARHDLGRRHHRPGGDDRARRGLHVRAAHREPPGGRGRQAGRDPHRARSAPRAGERVPRYRRGPAGLPVVRVRIVADRVFRDRAEAGRALAEELAPVLSGPCVVAAIPRGGVAVALPIVERLRVPLTVAYARKLTAPFVPEFAFGALDEDGQMVLDPESVAGLGLSPDDVERAKARVWAEIERRMALYRVPPLAHHLPGAAVVLVDDGLATGLTMRVALEYARRHGAREITVAVPCAAMEAAKRFRRAADRLVSLIVDDAFTAVGTYYEDFSPVTDEDVVALLARAQDRKST